MENRVIENLKGEELLLLQIAGLAPSQDLIDSELDRRALHGPPQVRKARTRRSQQRSDIADVA